MMNMAHCRFHNTLQALKECKEHMEDEALSTQEDECRMRLIRLCSKICESYDAEFEAE